MLSWEIGHGQAQASLIGFQLSLCLSLVLVLGHVQLMLTHPLDTHTLRSLILLSNVLIICDSTATQPLLIDLVYLGLTGC